MEIVHLVQLNSNGKPKFLTYELEGDTINKTYGLVGGKTQSKLSHYKAKNVGKVNEVGPFQSARNERDKQVKLKTKEGYIAVESLDDLPDLTVTEKDIDLDNIPKEFCLSKPTAKVSVEQIDALIASGFARFFVKYNGGCHFVLRDSVGTIKVFTRRWDDHTLKYPGIVEAAYKRMPFNTLIAVELCVDPLLDMDHMMAFKAFASISKANTHEGVCKPDQSKSLALQKEYPVKAAVFCYLYLNGEKMWHEIADVQIGELMTDFHPLSSGDTFFMPQSAEFKSGKEALKLTKSVKDKIEGFIMWDGRLAMEVTMNGKPKRRACWKLKARGEMDVIAVAGVEGKVPGEFGSLQIIRMDAEGRPVEMGAISGLKDAERDPSYWDFPCVVEAGFDNIFPDTGLLQFGNFNHKHLDKTPEEVDLFQLP